jgi:glycosyltransferase involved in cell wall biosynthesis
MPSAQKTSVLSLQTPILGHRTYGESLRAAFAHSDTIAFDAHWSTESRDAHIGGRLERQLDRVFRKISDRAWMRSRNLDFFPLRYELGTSYWARRTLATLLRTSLPDVLHVHTQAISLLTLDVMKRIPTVVSADGTALQMAAQQVAPPWRWTYAGNVVLERAAFRAAAAVVAFSQWAADSVIADHRIEPGRVHVIPQGIDLTHFAYGLTRGEADVRGPVRLLFVGGEFERKGGPELVAAFLARFGDDPRVELDLVTRDARIAPHPRIRVHTNVRAYSDAWHALYRAASAFVLPSKRDQSPNVFLEAMAAGLPVVATQVGSVRETVLDGITGFVVASGDTPALGARLAALVDAPELRKRLGSAGRALVERRYESKANTAALERVLLAAARSASGTGVRTGS